MNKNTRKFIWNVIFFFISVDLLGEFAKKAVNGDWYWWIGAAFALICAYIFGGRVQETLKED